MKRGVSDASSTSLTLVEYIEQDESSRLFEEEQEFKLRGCRRKLQIKLYLKIMCPC